MLPKRIDRSILEGQSIVLFRAAIRSKQTLDPYERKLLTFLTWSNMTADGFVNFAKGKPKDDKFTYQLKMLATVKLIDRYEVGRKLEGSTGIVSLDLSPIGRSLVDGLIRRLLSLLIDNNTI